MSGPSVQRTIVKSKPELWSELSDAGSLSKHLGAFGEITITELEPETAVAWEGDRVRGTVTLERSGWGTKVTVTAEAAEVGAAPEAEAEVTEGSADTDPSDETASAVSSYPEEIVAAVMAEAEASVDVEDTSAEPDDRPAEATEPAKPLGFWARMMARWRKPSASSEAFAPPAEANASQPEPVAEPEPTPEPEAVEVPEPIVVPELDPEHEIVLTTMLDRLGQAHHRPFSRG